MLESPQSLPSNNNTYDNSQFRRLGSRSYSIDSPNYQARGSIGSSPTRINVETDVNQQTVVASPNGEENVNGGEKSKDCDNDSDKSSIFTNIVNYFTSPRKRKPSPKKKTLDRSNTISVSILVDDANKINCDGNQAPVHQNNSSDTSNIITNIVDYLKDSRIHRQKIASISSTDRSGDTPRNEMTIKSTQNNINKQHVRFSDITLSDESTRTNGNNLQNKDTTQDIPANTVVRLSDTNGIKGSISTVTDASKSRPMLNSRMRNNSEDSKTDWRPEIPFGDLEIELDEDTLLDDFFDDDEIEDDEIEEIRLRTKSKNTIGSRGKDFDREVDRLMAHNIGITSNRRMRQVRYLRYDTMCENL